MIEMSDFKLTEDYACIIHNICSYCDLCNYLILKWVLVTYMKNVDFSHVLEYYVNLENSAITPILLTVVENLVG